MPFALLELVVGAVVVLWLAMLIWSLAIILTTPRESWTASGMSQFLWLAVVVFMPMIGGVLFVTIARPRLAKHGAAAGSVN